MKAGDQQTDWMCALRPDDPCELFDPNPATSTVFRFHEDEDIFAKLLGGNVPRCLIRCLDEAAAACGVRRTMILDDRYRKAAVGMVPDRWKNFCRIGGDPVEEHQWTALGKRVCQRALFGEGGFVSVQKAMLIILALEAAANEVGNGDDIYKLIRISPVSFKINGYDAKFFNRHVNNCRQTKSRLLTACGQNGSRLELVQQISGEKCCTFTTARHLEHSLRHLNGARRVIDGVYLATAAQLHSKPSKLEGCMC